MGVSAAMSPVMVSAPQRVSDGAQHVLSATIEIGGEKHEVYYRVSQGPVASGAEAFLAAALLPAMKVASPLHVDGPISSFLLQHLPTFQSIMHAWYKDFREVAIEAAPAATPPACQPAGVACFFSGGVDSFYSALKHRDEITHLIFVHGFDINLDQRKLRHEISAALRQAAAELGKSLVEVETNVRPFMDAYGDWDFHMHGTALASVALALAGFRKAYIASAQSYDRLVPLGSHPLTNPLWSTEQMAIVHDGCEAKRWEKLEKICGDETVQRWLRVCWRNPGGRYNCESCDKCLLARAFIRVVGKQEQFRTFSPLLDLDELTRAASDEHMRGCLGRLLEHTQVYHSDSDVTKTIAAALAAPTKAEEAKNARLKQRVAELEAQLAQITGSRSWQVTAPLRASAKLARRMRPHS